MHFETALKNYHVAALAESQDRHSAARDAATTALDKAHADLLRAPVTSVQEVSALLDVLWVHYYPADTQDALNAPGAADLIDRVSVVLHGLAAQETEASHAHL